MRGLILFLILLIFAPMAVLSLAATVTTSTTPATTRITKATQHQFTSGQVGKFAFYGVHGRMSSVVFGTCSGCVARGDKTASDSVYYVGTTPQTNSRAWVQKPYSTARVVIFSDVHLSYSNYSSMTTRINSAMAYAGKSTKALLWTGDLITACMSEYTLLKATVGRIQTTYYDMLQYGIMGNHDLFSLYPGSVYNNYPTEYNFETSSYIVANVNMGDQVIQVADSKNFIPGSACILTAIPDYDSTTHTFISTVVSVDTGANTVTLSAPSTTTFTAQAAELRQGWSTYRQISKFTDSFSGTVDPGTKHIVEIGNTVFIMLNMDMYNKTLKIDNISQSDLDWFENNVATYTANGFNVIPMTHYPPGMSSAELGGIDFTWSTGYTSPVSDRFKQICQRYNPVIWVYGHNHSDPRTKVIHTDNIPLWGTTQFLTVPSLGYYLTPDDFTQGAFTLIDLASKDSTINFKFYNVTNAGVVSYIGMQSAALRYPQSFADARGIEKYKDGGKWKPVLQMPSATSSSRYQGNVYNADSVNQGIVLKNYHGSSVLKTLSGTNGLVATSADTTVKIGMPTFVTMSSASSFVGINTTKSQSSAISGSTYFSVKSGSTGPPRFELGAGSDSANTTVGVVSFVDPDIVGTDKRSSQMFGTRDPSSHYGSYSFQTKNADGLQTRVTIGASTNPYSVKLGTFTGAATARLHIMASNGTSGTVPIKLESGTLLASPEAGAIESDGTKLYFTNGSNVRSSLLYSLPVATNAVLGGVKSGTPGNVSIDADGYMTATATPSSGPAGTMQMSDGSGGFAAATNVTVSAAGGTPVMVIGDQSTNKAGRLELYGTANYPLNIYNGSGGLLRVDNTGLLWSAGGYRTFAGTSSQFFKADGSIDSTAYFPTTGGTISGNVGINVTPTVKLETSDSAAIQIQATNTAAQSSAGGAGLSLRHDDGTAMTAGNRVGYINIAGAKNTSHAITQAAQLKFMAAETFSNTAAGTNMLVMLPTTGSGSNTLVEKFTVFGDGVVKISGTASACPACASSYRGGICVVQGGAGVKDSSQICMKDAADVYAWRTIY